MEKSFFNCVVIFIALDYFTALVYCQKTRCIGQRNYCPGYGDMKPVCKSGYCYCNGKDYNYDTCLPDAYGCKIVANSDATYTCTPDKSSPKYEVHVLAVYEVINRRPPTAGKLAVNIISRKKSNRPTVLVLVSYEPVNWILNIPIGVTISKVILVSYYILESSVNGIVSRVKNIERIGTINSEWSTGYGTDSGGGNTVKTLKQIHKWFGVVTSFRGAYRTNQWSLELLPFNGTAKNDTNTTEAILPTVTATVRRMKCLGSYCSGQHGAMKAFCKDGYCNCNGKDYNYKTCLPDAYGCKIVSNSDTTYTCTPDNSSPKYEIHVLAVYEVINRRPPRAGKLTVNIISREKSNRAIVLVLINSEPVNWILNIPPDVTISKVILVSYYIAQSSVSGGGSQVKNIELIGTRNSEWSTGYGTDSGGGNTVKTLKQIHKLFGVVTSFSGAYRTNRWSLELSPFNGTVDKGNNGTTPILPNEKCLSRFCSGQHEDMKAFCKDGDCYCNGTDYDYDTCLPDAYGCKIVSNFDAIYTCNPDNSSPQFEVHVLSMYEVFHRRPPTAGNASVNIISHRRSKRPIVLVLVSHEPVNWILNIPSDISINEAILVSYYIDESSVSGDVHQVKIVQRKGTRSSDWDAGYGSDWDGGRTVELLKQIHKRYGVVTSFRGTYRTNQWSLKLSGDVLLPNCRYCGTATRFEKTKPTSNLNLFPHTKTEYNNGRNTNSSDVDQNEYYLMLILVPLMIALGFAADRYLKKREKRMMQHNQPVRDRNVYVNHTYNQR